ncbi:VTT domain-containing protein [Streptomyces sp. XM4011]|uniref:DedA family protein n=1 Tax=Streptomyces sp. XM4011 TaxID=2929780 RepID=UPI001FFA5A07|nr:VTT domain-containing protein [Streptomyces sp. XM4011]MCK1813980.1 VTT domain-containing protein [Streptomyces sp. XM4011]
MDADSLAAAAGHAEPWAYAVLFLATAAPLAPNGTLVVLAGALAARGDLSLLLVASAVLAGTLTGDLGLYGTARRLRGRTRARTRRWPLPGRPRTARLAELTGAASARLRSGGGAFLVPLRFVPCGRATGAAAAGLSGYPVARYATAAVVAEVSWTALYVALGYGGHSAVSGPVPVWALGAVAGAAGAVWWLAARRRRSPGPPAAPAAVPATRPGAAPRPVPVPVPVALRGRPALARGTR